MNWDSIETSEEYYNLVVDGNKVCVEVYCLGMSNNAMNEFLMTPLPPDLQTNFWNITIHFKVDKYFGCQNHLSRVDALKKASEIISEKYSTDPKQIFRMMNLNELLK